MKKLTTVTVYRYDEKNNVWSKRELKNVFCTGTNESYALSDTLNKDAKLILRVLKDTDCDVFPSDVIFLGTHQGETPPDGGNVVISVTRNKHGINTRHTKILCR